MRECVCNHVLNMNFFNDTDTDELPVAVMRFLPIESLLVMMRVNSRFLRIARDDTFWRPACTARLHGAKNMRQLQGNWYDFFKTQYILSNLTQKVKRLELQVKLLQRPSPSKLCFAINLVCGKCTEINNSPMPSRCLFDPNTATVLVDIDDSILLFIDQNLWVNRGGVVYDWIDSIMVLKRMNDICDTCCKTCNAPVPITGLMVINEFECANNL